MTLSFLCFSLDRQAQSVVVASTCAWIAFNVKMSFDTLESLQYRPHMARTHAQTAHCSTSAPHIHHHSLAALCCYKLTIIILYNVFRSFWSFSFSWSWSSTTERGTRSNHGRYYIIPTQQPPPITTTTTARPLPLPT